MSFEDRAMQSNLECFLRRTTPIVPYRLLPKSEERNQSQLWYPWERDSIEFFTLADLWSRYDEWSAYGAGVPIRLSSGETLIQYYVPYLSAVQIYTSSSSIRSFREDAESGDSETWYSFSDSWSDDSENEKQWRWDGNSSEDGGIEPDALGHLNRLGHLYFQYFERSAPYARVPLMDKISGLSQTYPGLLSLRSVDLAPASWMAVSWYPIYHIPMGRTIKDLSTCFLTYHTLSSSFQDMDLDAEMEIKEKKRKEGEGIALPPFGLATYKMQGNVWVSSGEQERLKSLLRVADSWLKQLKVQHHDFNYFGRFQHVYELR